MLIVSQMTLSQGTVGGKGMRCESSAIKLSVCVSKFLCSSVKAGHWETEKAEYKNARVNLYLIWHESQDLL